MAEKSGFPSPHDQDRILEEARKSVKKAAFYMKKALDEDNMREGLRNARDVLGELRSSQLNPQKYYEMYMQVFDELTHLRVFISEEQRRGKAFSELYELVQHAGNVLPRLYLMCTVGCEYIKAKEANPRDTLKDLVELCKGVQHPTRGLFLRSYLCQVSRGLLPDVGSEYEGEGGNIHDAIDFLLSNFIEMNKLWVRMQYQGSKFDLEKREEERRMLQDLVGKNLTFLSQLDGLDFNLYSGTVLKGVLDQIVSCEDVIAQQYLMQCIIQCFPDEFHLGTLDDVLSALPKLKDGVKVHLIMSGLMDRLALYAENRPDAVQKSNAFSRLQETCAKVIREHASMHAQEVIDMYKAMLHFTGNVYSDRLDYVNEILGECYKALSERPSMSDQKSETSLVNLLSSPLSQYDVIHVLCLDSYPRLMDLLKVRKRKDMAVKIVQAVVDGGFTVDSFENVERLLTFIGPLMKDVNGFQEEQEEEDIADEQGMVARVVQFLWSENPAEQFKILQNVGQHLEEGEFARMKYTLPPLVFAGLKLVRSMSDIKNKAEKEGGAGLEGVTFDSVFDWLLRLCALMVEVPQPMMSLRCLLQCGYSASEEAGLEETAYDCFEQACILFEESISSSAEKGTALSSIIGTLHRCHVFGVDNRAALVQTVSGYCSQLLKKEEQCKAVCMYSHLYWQAEDEDEKATTRGEPPVRNTSMVMRSLKRCLKLADKALRRRVMLKGMWKASTEPMALYVELLNTYLFYYERGNVEITVEVLQQLLDLVSSEMADREVSQPVAKFYQNTLDHLAVLKEGASKDRYKGINIPKVPTNWSSVLSAIL
ncbi:hypothetical protein BSKO_06709 [Bryopsis sp. KO-2023]|nr:hypothetical protein BSKO_06709 [Bryopsis sp. KO-2023]